MRISLHRLIGDARAGRRLIERFVERPGRTHSYRLLERGASSLRIASPLRQKGHFCVSALAWTDGSVLVQIGGDVRGEHKVVALSAVP